MLTVQDLIDIDLLQLEPVAGLAATSRPITWAHAVDLPDPWRWVSSGDLVMTTGVGMPFDGEQQVVWLEQLVQSNASALVVAPRQDAAPLSEQMLNAANRLLFPVLLASFELEFVKLSHLVIESVLQAQRERFNASERLFQTYADALRKAPDMAARLMILARTLKLDLGIEDSASGVNILGTPAIANRGQRIERIPAGGRSQANLVLSYTAKRSVDDSILVRSLVGLLGVELERLMIHRDMLREEGSALLASLMESENQFPLALPLLERRGLNGALVCVAIAPGAAGSWHVDELHHAPALHNSPLLLAKDNDVLLAVTCDVAKAFIALEASLGQGTILGISRSITAATGFRESVRQARLALVQAREVGATRLRYGDTETGLIMAPKSLPEARALVGRYLGPLMEHDRMQSAALLPTLMAFLSNDGNWKATSLDLNIHRQTLVYRLKLVEQLTGLKPTSTQGITRFWIAIQAGQNTGLLDSGP